MKIFKIENRGLDKIITILNKEFVLKNYKLKQYIKKNKLSTYDTICFLLVNAGESFVISQYIKEISKNHTIFLCQHNYSNEIFEMYAPDAEVKLINSNKICNLLRESGKEKININNIDVNILFPQSFWDEFWTNERPVHFLEKFNSYFSKIEEYKFKPPKINNNQEFLKNFNLQNLIVLFTEVSSIKPINKTFWEALVKKLKNQGYNVFQNTVNPDNYINGCNVFKENGVLKYLTLEQCYILLSNAKGVIAHRCGFIEPLITANNNWQVIYTRSHTFENTDVKTLYSLQKYPMANASRIMEYQFEDYENEELLIDTMIEKIKGE